MSETLHEKLMKTIPAGLNDPEGPGSDLPLSFTWDEDLEVLNVTDGNDEAGTLDLRHLVNDIVAVVEQHYAEEIRKAEQRGRIQSLRDAHIEVYDLLPNAPSKAQADRMKYFLGYVGAIIENEERKL